MVPPRELLRGASWFICLAILVAWVGRAVLAWRALWGWKAISLLALCCSRLVGPLVLVVCLAVFVQVFLSLVDSVWSSSGAWTGIAP